MSPMVDRVAIIRTGARAWSADGCTDEPVARNENQPQLCGDRSHPDRHDARGIAWETEELKTMGSESEQPTDPFEDAGVGELFEAHLAEENPPESGTLNTNPYEASVVGAGAGWGPVSVSLPTYVVVMMILAILFSAMRFFGGAVGAIGLTLVSTEVVGAHYLHMEVALQLISGVLGIVAGILVLLKKPSGVLFSWTYVLAIAASLVVDVIQLIQGTSRGVPPQLAADPRLATSVTVGVVLVSVITLIVRLMLLALFVVAVVKYARWLESRRRVTTGGFNFR